MERPRASTLLLGLAAAAYPFLVYFGLGRLGPRHFAVILGLLALARVGFTRGLRTAGAAAWASALLAGALAVATLIHPHPRLPLLYPVAISLGFLATFSLSLLHPPSMIERLARLTTPDLDARGVAYTRRVTVAWCAFFVVNGSIALWTALLAPLKVWMLWNGLLSYLAMGIFFGVEFLVRRRVQRKAA